MTDPFKFWLHNVGKIDKEFMRFMRLLKDS